MTVLIIKTNNNHNDNHESNNNDNGDISKYESVHTIVITITT